MTARVTQSYIQDNSRTEGEQKQAFADMIAMIQEHLGGQPESELTISSGQITPTTGLHTVDTESDAASDDLANIKLANHPDGRLVWLRPANASRTVVVKHGAGGNGQIITTDGNDVTLDETTDSVLLQRRGTDWEEILRVPPEIGGFAGDGLKEGSTGEIDIEPVDFAGRGLEDDGSDNLQTLDSLPPTATDGGTDAYTVTSGYTLTTDLVFRVQFGSANTTTSPTLDDNSQGVTSIVDVNGNAWAGMLQARVHTLWYDGTNYVVLDPYSKLSSVFETGELSISLDSTITVSHGFGVTPNFVKGILRCKTAELGYDVGDEVALPEQANPASGSSQNWYGATLFANDTNVGVAVGGSFIIFDKNGSGSNNSLTASNWKLVITAWL